MALSVDPDHITNLNQEGVYQYLSGLGYPVTRRMIKYAVLRRELIAVRLGRGNFWSRADSRSWVESRRQPGVYRAPEAKANK